MNLFHTVVSLTNGLDVKEIQQTLPVWYLLQTAIVLSLVSAVVSWNFMRKKSVYVYKVLHSFNTDFVYVLVQFDAAGKNKMILTLN